MHGRVAVGDGHRLADHGLVGGEVAGRHRAALALHRRGDRLGQGVPVERPARRARRWRRGRRPAPAARRGGRAAPAPPSTNHGLAAAPPRSSRARDATSASAMFALVGDAPRREVDGRRRPRGRTAGGRGARGRRRGRRRGPGRRRSRPRPAAAAPQAGRRAADAVERDEVAVSADRTISSASPPSPHAAGSTTASAKAAATAASTALPPSAPTRRPACTASGWPAARARSRPAQAGRGRRVGMPQVSWRCGAAKAVHSAAEVALTGTQGGSPVQGRHGPAAVRDVRRPRRTRRPLVREGWEGQGGGRCQTVPRHASRVRTPASDNPSPPRRQEAPDDPHQGPRRGGDGAARDPHRGPGRRTSAPGCAS